MQNEAIDYQKQKTKNKKQKFKNTQNIEIFFKKTARNHTIWYRLLLFHTSRNAED